VTIESNIYYRDIICGNAFDSIQFNGDLFINVLKTNNIYDNYVLINIISLLKFYKYESHHEFSTSTLFNAKIDYINKRITLSDFNRQIKLIYKRYFWLSEYNRIISWLRYQVGDIFISLTNDLLVKPAVIKIKSIRNTFNTISLTYNQYHSGFISPIEMDFNPIINLDTRGIITKYYPTTIFNYPNLLNRIKKDISAISPQLISPAYAKYIKMYVINNSLPYIHLHQALNYFYNTYETLISYCLVKLDNRLLPIDIKLLSSFPYLMGFNYINEITSLDPEYDFLLYLLQMNIICQSQQDMVINLKLNDIRDSIIIYIKGIKIFMRYCFNYNKLLFKSMLNVHHINIPKYLYLSDRNDDDVLKLYDYYKEITILLPILRVMIETVKI